MSAHILIGTGWGDEGKGKFTDFFASDYTHIVRAQGGPNAGHTLVVGESEYKLHHIPSGILHPQARCYIAAGTILDPEILLQEISTLKNSGISLEKRFFLSRHCHLILPYHKELDAFYEEKREGEKIGTTKRGIGPCLADKALRIGVRLADGTDQKHLLSLLKTRYSLACQAVGKALPHPPEELLPALQEAFAQLAPYIAPVEELLQEAIENQETLFFEGAQGALLDWQFGTYPFVTSSCTLSSGLLASAGIAPQLCSKVIGVVKAYSSRVGSGPFPTEDPLFADPKSIREIGTTTGRNRRVGWLDLFALRHAIRLNGVTELALTKLDILDAFSQIHVCVGYEKQGTSLAAFPTTSEEFSEVKPVYKTFPGWPSHPTKHLQNSSDLPLEASAYLCFIEEFVKCPIRWVSTGPKREHTLKR